MDLNPCHQQSNSRNYNFNLLLKHLIFFCNLFIFKILGLAPFGINISKIFKNDNHKNNQAYPYTFSKYGFLYNIFLIFLLCAYIIITYIFNVLVPASNSNLIKIVLTSVRLFGIIGAIVTWFVYIYHQKTIVNIANELYDVDNYLKICKYYSLERDYHTYYIFIGNILIYGGVFLLNLTLYFTLKMPLWMLPCTISSWVFTQYAMVLNFITQRFKSINKTILKIGKMDTESEPDTVLSKKITLSELIVNDIQIINYSDMKLCNICSETSDFYSLPALIAIIYFMAIAMFNLYYLFMAIVTNNFEEYTVLDAIESTATFLMTFNNFVALNTNVIRIKREFENTATNIHLLMDRCILNLEVKRVLSGFSWDLLHRNVRFSTYKIIEFDGSLLQSVNSHVDIARKKNCSFLNQNIVVKHFCSIKGTPIYIVNATT